MNRPLLSVVVIGRNEGDRLVRCLQSIVSARMMPENTELIYIDSGSTDGSPERAVALGARVIVLGAGRLSAARARNAGWRSTEARFILFLDGDTILDPDFVHRGMKEFGDPQVAVVWGHRRELCPGASAYNRIVDLDWIARPGLSDFCGGDSLMRREALEQTNGFDPDLIAGEEPDLCRRIREKGGQILHIDVPMTGHDIALLRFGQYWRRAVRTGFAYAEVAARYRNTADPLWWKESRGNRLRGSLYLLTCAATFVASALLHSWLPLIALTLCGCGLAVRTALSSRWKGASWPTLLLFGIHSHAQHVPILQGQLLYSWGRWRGQRRGLIEYKSS